MTWAQLLAWIEDPARTNEELRDAAMGLGIPNPQLGNRVQKRARLRTFIGAQPQAGNAIWAPGAPPLPPPPPVTPPVPASTTTGLGSAVGVVVGLIGVATIAAIVLGILAILLATDVIGGDNDNSGVVVTIPTTSPAYAATTPAPGDNTTAGTGTMPDLSKDGSHGNWTIKETANINSDPVVRDWLSRLEDPNPNQWKYFPNVGNPDRPDFPSEPDRPAPWGAEYGVANVPFCQQDMRCDFQVPGWSYRLVTADYGFLDRTCQNDGTKGCLLLLINVSDQSFTWRNQMADNGFTVHGRYWDGDHLEWATLGLVSHASANMLNLPTFARAGEVLNAGSSSSNAGANCGNQPEACSSVDVRVVVHAADRILAEATTTVSR